MVPLLSLSLLCLVLAVLAAAFLVRTKSAVVRHVQAERERQERMLTDLSHNLQTPLAILKGKVERFERTMLHDGHAGTLGHSIDTLSHFINEVLALSNLERSIREEERAPFPLSELVHETVNEALLLAESAGITLAHDIAPGMTLMGNERRMGDAVMNLLSNAIKYMGNGPVRRIRVSLARHDGHMVLEIADTGMGITKEDLPHIFERFYRGSMRTYGKERGTGLGLAFVERIVKEHGGTVTVTSEVGKGSTFTLRFPELKARSQKRPS